MNIFVLDTDPKLAAKYHCDKHVVKMVTESLQMLASAHWYLNGVKKKKDIALSSPSLWKNFPRNSPYGIGYIHHPCTVWVRSSDKNWMWLIQLCESLIEEHKNRYGKYTNSKNILAWFLNNKPVFPSSEFTQFPLAMPVELKSENIVHSYRLFYAGWKEYFAKWKNGEPHWWKQYLKYTVSQNLMSDKVLARKNLGTHSL